MKRTFLAVAVCCGLLGSYILVRWIGMYEESGSFNQFTIFVNDLSDTLPPSVEWCFFRNWDFPTGKCETLVDIPMAWIGFALLGLAVLSGLGLRFGKHRHAAR